MDALTSLSYFIPELVVTGTAFTVLFLDLFLKSKKPLFVLGIAGLTAAIFVSRRPDAVYPLFFGFFSLDPFSHFFKIFALSVTALSLGAALAWQPRREDGGPEGFPSGGEYVTLFLFSALGLILMAGSTNLLMIFLSIEFVSILSYLLVGFQKKSPASKEAAIKYLLFGSVCSGVMLFGMSLLFGVTGNIDLLLIGQALRDPSVPQPFIATALFLVMAGLGFKISMAPFHLWAPDVYQGAPTPVTAFLTVGPKALGFAVFLRLLHAAFPEFHASWSFILAALSILTMTAGNVTAVAQTNVKRLLGYSSIAQAGYILMGLAVSNAMGLKGVLIYLGTYLFTNLGAFLCVIAASNDSGSDDLDAFTGLSQRSPFLALSFTVFLLSLAGLPPLAGFIGKYYVFSSAIDGGFITLAVAAALNSAVAAFYYFKIVRKMYLVPSGPAQPLRLSPVLVVLLLMTLAGTFTLGIFPAPLIAFVEGCFIG